uniref:Uncharacterized protein n=1 Tax=Nelumbo nucifera TaxID=4432 RepID=A0A822YPY2_NELNU|nr:TPA_asm: hypothetical protein HUJ06_011936 [Nelumbo nucifera]
MKTLLILVITVGWMYLATQPADANKLEVTSSKYTVAEHKKNSYQLPPDNPKYVVNLGRKVQVGRTGANNLTAKTRDPGIGHAAEDFNNEAIKVDNGIDDDNESFGRHGHPSGSSTNTHHVYPDYKQPPH